MSTRKRGLGRGLDALLATVQPGAAPDGGDELRELPLDAVGPGAHQPRRHFDPVALDELSQSIAAQGVVQPIVVRPLSEDRYEIVAGERRWRAARQAGLSTIPAVVRSMDERSAMAVALVENIQRADLNPLEEAEALRKLIERCSLTHEQVAEAVGRSRVAVTNLLRIMELPAPVQSLLREGRLSLGHAKALMGVDPERREALALEVVARQLNVRQTEALARAGQMAPRPRPPEEAPPLQSELTTRLGMPVQLKATRNGAGKLTISYRSDEDLERLVSLLGLAAR